MEKKKIAYIALFMYEVIQIMLVLSVQTEEAIAVLPLSWYAGAALICIPLLLCYFLFIDEQKYSVFLPLLGTMKMCMCVAFASYIIVDLPYALNLGAFDNFYSLKSILFVLLFIIIDVILSVIIFSRNAAVKKEQKDADTSSGDSTCNGSISNTVACNTEDAGHTEEQ